MAFSMEDCRKFNNPSPPPPVDTVEEVKKEAMIKKIKKEPKDESEEDESDVLAVFLDRQAFRSTEKAYVCDVCECEMNSEAIYINHLKGRKHKKKLEALNFIVPADVKPLGPEVNIQKIKTIGCPMVIPTRHVNCTSYIQPAIEKHMDSPIIGLDFITEVRMLNDKDPVYQCQLCPVECQSMSLISHVTGCKHRMAYLKLVDPQTYWTVESSQGRKSNLSECMEKIAAKYEAMDGRGTIMVETQIDLEKDDLGIIEKVQPKFPKSVDQLAWDQAKALSPSSQAQLVVKIAEALPVTSVASDAAFEKLATLLNSCEEFLHDLVIEQLKADDEKMKQVVALLKAGECKKVLELLYDMKIEMGLLAQPTVAALLREDGIKVPIKEEPKNITK